MRSLFGIMLVAIAVGCSKPQPDINPFKGTQFLITYKTEPPMVITASMTPQFHETGHSAPHSGFDQRVRWQIDGESVTLTLISENQEYSSKQFTTFSPSQLLFDEAKIRVEIKTKE